MKTLNEVRQELWEAGQKYANACIELGLSKDLAIEKFVTSATKIDKDTLIIAKCSIVHTYNI